LQGSFHYRLVRATPLAQHHPTKSTPAKAGMHRKLLKTTPRR
jgi:hypothetical protein